MGGPVMQPGMQYIPGGGNMGNCKQGEKSISF